MLTIRRCQMNKSHRQNITFKKLHNLSNSCRRHRSHTNNNISKSAQWCTCQRPKCSRWNIVMQLFTSRRVSDLLSLKRILKRPTLICMSGTVRNGLTSVPWLQIQLEAVSSNIRRKDCEQFVHLFCSYLKNTTQLEITNKEDVQRHQLAILGSDPEISSAWAKIYTKSHAAAQNAAFLIYSYRGPLVLATWQFCCSLRPTEKVFHLLW